MGSWLYQALAQVLHVVVHDLEECIDLGALSKDPPEFFRHWRGNWPCAELIQLGSGAVASYPGRLEHTEGPCACGLTFDDVERMVIYPHPYVGQSALYPVQG